MRTRPRGTTATLFGVKLFSFGHDVAFQIHHFDSVGAHLARGVRTAGAAQVSCLHLGANGVLGRHPATAPQLLMVVAGSGWVEGGDGQRQAVRAGDAAFWEAGELHTTGTHDGLTAMLVEAADLDPGQFMPPRVVQATPGLGRRAHVPQP